MFYLWKVQIPCLSNSNMYKTKAPTGNLHEIKRFFCNKVLTSSPTKIWRLQRELISRCPFLEQNLRQSALGEGFLVPSHARTLFPPRLVALWLLIGAMEVFQFVYLNCCVAMRPMALVGDRKCEARWAVAIIYLEQIVPRKPEQTSLTAPSRKASSA